MTAWLLTWLWQGSALAAGVAVALRCAPRRNAATRHLIGAPPSRQWPGSAGRVRRTGRLPPYLSRGSDPIYIPSAPDFLINIFVGIWAAIALVSLLRVLPGLRARVRGARPLPSVSVEHRVAASALARSESARPP